MKYRWWLPWLIALYWIFAVAIFGCGAPVKVSQPNSLYVDGNTLTISRYVNGGTWLCLEQRNGVGPNDCIQVQQLRRLVKYQRFGN